jgi:hypothetical protein
VDGPTPSNLTSSPFDLMVTARGSDALLIWQSNLQSDFACTFYYQWSNDGGTTWSDRTRILGEFVGCPRENVLLETSQGFTLLQTTIRDEVYMLAWNGEAWSKAFPQDTLSGFNDPLTNEPVRYRCRQNTVQSGTAIHVIGCNDAGVVDVWVTSRAVGTKEDWFPPTTIWDAPVMVLESENELSSVQAVADQYGVFHILWLQVDKIVDSRTQRSIFYTRFENNVLSQPGRVLPSSDSGVEDFSLAYDRSRDRLVVVWTDATTGEINYSWADISRAASKFEWSKAVILPTVRPLVKSPNILITPDGTIHVAYAVPVNEGRGVYLISSNDGGENWGQTVEVFAVSEPDWQAIDFPIMASSGDEILHMLWRREKVIGEVGIVGLCYAMSKDRGQSWSTPQIISNDPVQGAWIIDGGNEGLHRFWLTMLGSKSSLIHDGSMDQGANWTNQDNLTRLGETPGIAQPFTDINGWINFTQVVENSPQNLVINHQRNDDGRWETLKNLELGDGTVEEITSLAAQVLLDGRLVLAYTVKESKTGEGEMPYRLYLAPQSQLAVQATTTAVARLVSPTKPPVVPEPTLNATEPASTPVPTESTAPPTPGIDQITVDPVDQTPAMDTTTGLALSGGLVILVVVGFFVYIRLRRS